MKITTAIAAFVCIMSALCACTAPRMTTPAIATKVAAEPMMTEATRAEFRFSLPADWVFYQAPRATYGFYHPPGFAISSEQGNRVVFSGLYSETLTLDIVQAQCGLGVDDVNEEEIQACLAAGGGRLTGSILFSQSETWLNGKWVYTLSFIVQGVSSTPTSRIYMLITALPENRMAVGIYQAPVLGPRTRLDLTRIVSTIRMGNLQVPRVTPTAQPTPTAVLGVLPVITPLPEATVPPAVAPDGWVESTCQGCRITYYHPADWQLIHEQNDNMLWQSVGTGLVLVGAGAAPCMLSDPNQEAALSCLVDARSGQAPADAEFIPLAGGVIENDLGPIYWFEYRSSTPDDKRPLYGLVFYRLLEDHRMLTFEYGNLGGQPEAAERLDLELVAASARLSSANRVTPTPAAQASATP
jgi:hypothetical protein